MTRRTTIYLQARIGWEIARLSTERSSYFFFLSDSKEVQQAKLEFLQAIQRFLEGRPQEGRFARKSFREVLGLYSALLLARYNNSAEKTVARAYASLLNDLSDSLDFLGLDPDQVTAMAAIVAPSVFGDTGGTGG